MSVTFPVVAMSRTTGLPVDIGDTVISGKSDRGILTAITRAAIPGKSGKVTVCVRGTDEQCTHRYHIEHYDAVWGLNIVTLLPCGHHLSMTHDCGCPLVTDV